MFNVFYWKGVGGSPSQQANNKMFRVKDFLKNCIIFRDKDPFLEYIVLFSNPKASFTISREPEYGCKIIHFKKTSDTNLADFIMNQPIHLSDQEVTKIEQGLRANITNYQVWQSA